MKSKYVLGIDYGTLSGRTVLVRCSDGMVMSSAVKNYSHGVISEYLPSGAVLPKQNWALQYPLDYLEVLWETIPTVVRESEVDAADIIGLSIDFTSCTVLPVDRDKKPLCMKEEYADRPHAYVKLWKHHGAQQEADEINELLKSEDAMQALVGTKISPEVFLPKILEIIHKDYEIYQEADKFLEAADWLTWLLTDSKKCSASMAGYKAWWSSKVGYPAPSFLRKIDKRVENLYKEKLFSEVCPVGKRIGILSEEWSRKLGLKQGIAVGASIIDSHAGAPGSGVANTGQLMLVIGTSSVVMAFADKPMNGEGVYGAFKGGVVPEYYGLESGLAAVGDMLGWFVEKCVPEEYYREARRNGLSIHQYLTKLASKQKPGESGLLALDWFNGNKTPFVNANLSGMLMGMTLNTRPEEIYRAFIEATAFGTRRIIEVMETYNANVKEIVASGGIADKNAFFLQVYADVTGKQIKVAASSQTAALGSAIYAALAAGKEAGGYDSYEEAVEAMSRTKEMVYKPNKENAIQYDKLYELYIQMSELVGEAGSMMMRLAELKVNK